MARLGVSGGAAGRALRAAGLLLLAAASPPALAEGLPLAEGPPSLPASPAAMCRQAGAEAERGHGLPAGLLLAIGRVESGRRDPATGQVSAWPWTVNAAGEGRLFETAAEALDAARAARARGVASIDVGCFQVNLLHHPAAFAGLEEAFDPGANARYAARFLALLRLRAGSWEGAVAAYHSAVPERGGPYRDRVLASWGGTPGPMPGSMPGPMTGPMPGSMTGPMTGPGPAARVEPAAWRPAPGVAGVRVWTPSPPGSAPVVISLRGLPAPAQAAVQAAPVPRG